MSKDVREVLAATRRARLVIKILGAVLVASFGWLQYRNTPIGQALQGASPELLLRLSLLLYFVCWIYGTYNDTDEQELAYQAGLDAGFPRWGYASAIAIALVFGVLCLVRSATAFALVLSGFLLLNVIAWRLLVGKVVRNAEAKSAVEYAAQADAGSEIILTSFVEYISGRWQWWRFLYGAILCALMVFVAFLGVPFSLPAYLGRDLLLAILLAFYVVTFEGWIWYMRLRVRLFREAVERIEASSEPTAFLSAKETGAVDS